MRKALSLSAIFTTFKKQSFEYQLLVLLFVSFIALITASAWVCDDSFITFRVVDNFLNGYGLRWNITERVQAFTNPLMLFIMIVFSYFTGEVYYTAIFVNVVSSSIAAYILLFHISQNLRVSIAISLFMIFSKSFISFTTSGLENSLSFLILALFFNEYFKNSDSSKNNVLMLSMYFALALFNRIDSILIYLPAFLYYFFFISQERFLKKLCFSFLGFLPFLIWYGFAFVYYGFIFPNTYYAKLNTGIPVIEYWVRGWHYYIANFLYDPITLLVILSSICLLIFQFQRRFFPILVSFAWISAYIIHIGGDFMMGRLFAVPFFISLIIFSQINWKVFSKNKIILGIVSIFIVQNIYSNVYEAGFVGSFSSEITSKIVVERAFYFNDTSLKNNLRKTGINNQIWAKDGKRFKAENINLVEFGCIGFAGYFAGSSVHIVDDLALSDAFLTQAPIMHHYTNINWKVGHLKRKIPRGYLESIASGENRIEDAEMAIRYDKIKLITQAPLFQKERWDAILDLNFGIR